MFVFVVVILKLEPLLTFLIDILLERLHKVHSLLRPHLIKSKVTFSDISGNPVKSDKTKAEN